MCILWWGVEETGIEALSCTRLLLHLRHSSNIVLRTYTAKLKESRQNRKVQKELKSLHWTKFCERRGRLGRWCWLRHFFLLLHHWWRVSGMWCPAGACQWNFVRHLWPAWQTIRPVNTHIHTLHFCLTQQYVAVLHLWPVPWNKLLSLLWHYFLEDGYTFWYQTNCTKAVKDDKYCCQGTKCWHHAGTICQVRKTAMLKRIWLQDYIPSVIEACCFKAVMVSQKSCSGSNFHRWINIPVTQPTA